MIYILFKHRRKGAYGSVATVLVKVCHNIKMHEMLKMMSFCVCKSTRIKTISPCDKKLFFFFHKMWFRCATYHSLVFVMFDK